MPAESHGVPNAGIPSAHDQRRRSERRPCSVAVVVETPYGEVRAQLTDVSEGGIGFSAGTLAQIRPGERLRITCREFGDLPCLVRWAIPPRYGAEVVAGSIGIARLKAFYDSLTRGPGELL